MSLGITCLLKSGTREIRISSSGLNQLPVPYQRASLRQTTKTENLRSTESPRFPLIDDYVRIGGGAIPKGPSSYLGSLSVSRHFDHIPMTTFYHTITGKPCSVSNCQQLLDVDPVK